MSRLVAAALVVVVVGAALAARPAYAQGSALAGVEIEGQLLEPKQQLERYLGLSPGQPFSEEELDRITSDLDRLGYRLLDSHLEMAKGGMVLRLHVAPVRVVRNIFVHGNWPLFDDEILRHLTVRSGSRLRPDDELRAFLDEEGQRVETFLQSDGFFGGSVKITPHTTPKPNEIDLVVDVDLGRWFHLGSVAATGNRAISTNELFDTFNHCCFFWGRFQIARMREDARTAEGLLRDRGFPAARVLPHFNLEQDVVKKSGKVRLPIRVSEKKKIEVSFIGNRSLTDRDLRDQLTIFSSGAYDDTELEDSARAIQRFYQTHGYFEAKVGYRRHRGGPDVEQITFQIDEGPELKVRAVELASAQATPLHFTDAELTAGAELETKVFPRLGLIGLGQGGYATTVQLRQDVARLVDFYRSEGFAQVKVRAEAARHQSSLGSLGALGADVASIDDEGGGEGDLYVRFVIDEGAQERVASVAVSFAGPHQLDSARLRKLLVEMKPGEPYTAQAFDEDRERVARFYGQHGHPYVLIDPTHSTWNAAHDRIALRLIIEEGPLVHFGQILIRGNFKTRDRVIRADLPFSPGDVFDVAKLEQADANLNTHLIFAFAKTTPVGLTEQRNPVPILVTVQERYLERFGSLGVAAGAATDRLPYYYYVSAGWQWNNFFGFGSQLELRGDFDWVNSWGATLRYTDLRAFGPGWRFDFTAFWRREVTYRLGEIESRGASIGLTRYFTPALRGYLRYDNYLSQTGVGFYRINGANDLPSVTDNTHTTKLVTGVLWERRVGFDGRPNPLMPVDGWLLSGSLGWAFPSPVNNPVLDVLAGDHDFLVFSGQALDLLPFHVHGTEFTLITNLRFDEGVPLGESALPAVERFFAGGDTTTRGYEPDQLKTEIVRGDVAPLGGQEGIRVIPQGGNIRLLSTVELQFPISKTFLGLPFPWVGALFWDMGAIADAPNLVQASDFKHSVGITLLRILTPVGPLSFEYAYPLTQSLAEERWKTNPWYSHFPGRLHFNWGIPLSRI